jgi:hypothetical protein
LLVGYESNELDKISIAKVADFGTVRADDRNKSDVLHTSAQTHAFTQRVVGTTPYMPAEVRSRLETYPIVYPSACNSLCCGPQYTGRGHVSEKVSSETHFTRSHFIIDMVTHGALILNAPPLPPPLPPHTYVC